MINLYNDKYFFGREKETRPLIINIKISNKTKGILSMKTSRTIIYTLFLLNLIFGFTPFAQLAHSICPHNFSEGVIDIDQIKSIAQTVTSQKYPNADVVYIDQKHWVSYNPDGTYEEWDAHAVKIMTEKGKRQFQTISSYFTIPYNTTAFKRIEIIQADGKRIPVDIEKNSRITIEHGQMKNNIYNPNQKVLRMNIPQLNVGDVLYTELMDIFSKVRTPDTWSDYIGFESVYPIVRMEYEVCAPLELPLERIVIKNEISGTIEHQKAETDTHISYRWIARNVPQAFPEPNMPPMYSQIQRLLVSTVKDWEDISRWYWQLCKDPINETTPEMTEMVQTLVSDTPTSMEKIKKIFFWVSQKVRYLGLTVETEAPGYEPHPVKMTFERRAGVCRDKAALLVAMLRLAGFEAYPVLIMNGPKKDPEVPQAFFNHAVSCVRGDDGEYILMDATDENTRELFPTYLNDQSYLVASPDGDHLRTSPVATAEKNMMHIKTSGKLNSNGELTAESILSFEGINDNAYRGYFSRIPAEERQAFLENLVKNIAPGAKLNNYTIQPQDMSNTDQTLTISLRFQASDIRIQENDTTMLPVFQTGTNVGIVRHLIGKMGLKKRKYPLKTHYACGVEEHLDLELGKSVGQLIRSPLFHPVENEDVTYQRTMSVKNNHLTGTYIFKLKKPEYTTESYQQLLETLKIIEHNSKKIPIFATYGLSERTKQKWYESSNPDALVIDESVHYDIQNRHKWTETRKLSIKILTYAGKKRFSDLQVSYQPAWENVLIQDVKVITKDGNETLINENEINTMDAIWAGDAPRYPAAKTLVVSFPGVDVGSIISYTLVKEIKYQPFFSNLSVWPSNDGKSQSLSEQPVLTVNPYFRYRVPIEKKSVLFSFPQNIQPDIQIYPNGFGDFYEKDHLVKIHKHEDLKKNRKQYTFTAEKILPIKSEHYLPPWYAFNPVVTVTFGNWKDYAEHFFARLTLASLEQSKTIEKAKHLTASIKNPLAKIKAIRDYIIENIRLIPISPDEIDIKHLSGPDQTLEDGYGHSTDRAIVLYAMIRSIGLSPKFVLVSKASKITLLQKSFKKICSHKWFQNIVLQIKVEDQTIYLNDTDQYASIGTTRYQGMSGLLLPDGVIETITPRTFDHQSNTIVHYTINLKTSGAAIITQTVKYYGMDYARFHKKNAEMPPEQKSRYHMELIAQISQAAEALAPYKADTTSYPGEELFSVTVDNYAVLDRNYIYLELPGFSQGLAGVRKDQRSHPLYRHHFSRKDVYVDIIAPKNLKCLVSPEDVNIHLSPTSQIRMQTINLSNKDYQKISIKQHIDISPLLIRPGLYSNFLEAHHRLNHMGSRMVLFEIQGGE
ncbi:Transglutaminase-like domain protein [Candidatus Magnetomorum sp. HK-1]|nr:Transglutaminase-like domain protein [Candidatus Magnetomorum sp. HK-1]